MELMGVSQSAEGWESQGSRLTSTAVGNWKVGAKGRKGTLKVPGSTGEIPLSNVWTLSLRSQPALISFRGPGSLTFRGHHKVKIMVCLVFVSRYMNERQLSPRGCSFTFIYMFLCTFRNEWKTLSCLVSTKKQVWRVSWQWRPRSEETVGTEAVYSRAAVKL